MPCKVGITTDPQTQKARMGRKSLRIKQLGTVRTPIPQEKQLKMRKNKLKAKYNCEGAPGGKDADGRLACIYV